MASFGQQPAAMVWPQAGGPAAFSQSYGAGGWTQQVGLPSYGQRPGTADANGWLGAFGQRPGTAGWPTGGPPAFLQHPSAGGWSSGTIGLHQQQPFAQSCAQSFGNQGFGIQANLGGWQTSSPDFGLHANPAGWNQGSTLPTYAWGQIAAQPQPITTSPSRNNAALEAFMRTLGIQPSEEVEFGWIAEYGLQEGILPERWTRQFDPATGNFYYVEGDSQQTTWENPLTPQLAQIIDIGRLYMEAPAEGFFEEQKVMIWEQHVADLEGWHGPLQDPSGREYFVNHITNDTSWHDPRLEAQFVFDVETDILNLLAQRVPGPEALSPLLPGFGSPRERSLHDPIAYDQGQQDAFPIEQGQESNPASPAGHKQSPKERIRNTVWLSAQKAATDCKSVAKMMSYAADRVYESAQDEFETQRLRLAHKEKVRQHRRQGKEPPPPPPSYARPQARKLRPLAGARTAGRLQCREAQDDSILP